MTLKENKKKMKKKNPTEWAHNQIYSSVKEFFYHVDT